MGVGGTLKRMAWNRVKARQLQVRNAEEFCCAVADSKVDISPEQIQETNEHYREALEKAP